MKTLSPLRQRDRAVGAQQERDRIVTWLLELDTDGDLNRYLPTTLAYWIREGLHKDERT